MKYLLEQLKAGTRNYIERTWPRSDLKIRIRLLTAQDMLDAQIAADKLYKDLGADVSMQNIREYEAEKDLQRLYRACTDLDGNPLAHTISDFRKALTVSERAWLVEQYYELDAEVNPSFEDISEGDFDALVESVKKNPDMLSSVSSMNTLRRLARFLASPPVTLPTGSGSISQ